MCVCPRPWACLQYVWGGGGLPSPRDLCAPPGSLIWCRGSKGNPLCWLAHCGRLQISGG